MRLSPAVRISIGLVALTLSLLLLAQLIGLVPDRRKAVLDSRKNLSEALAIQFSAAAQRGDLILIKETLQSLVTKDNDIKSAAVRSAKGDLMAEAGNHQARWRPTPDGHSTPTYVQIPIFKDQARWATVEMCFAPLWVDNIANSLKNSYLRLILFVACTGFAGYFLLIKRTLRELDPSAVVPGRVQAAFNVLKEGVLILDEKEQIVLANTSFAELVDRPPSQLIGFKGSELDWQNSKAQHIRKELPWIRVLKDGESIIGDRLLLKGHNDATVTFIVNAAPILDGKGTARGVLVTFDDITELEKKNLELAFLASHDPLTHLLNRRALNREFDLLFTHAQRRNRELSCIMCDIDHFKSVNDRYGHATGDKVIKMIADLLRNNCRENDLIGRYGGEEFCIVLPDIDLRQAAEIGNRIRQAVKADSSAGVQVTMSFGVSSLQSNAPDPGELTNQADKALYIAKESGRNRVVCWGDDEVSDFAADNTKRKIVPQKGEETGKEKYLFVQPAHELDTVENSDEVNRLTVRLQKIKELAEKRSLQLKHYTAYDVLTGLPTRTLFYDRILLALTRGRRYESIVAVLSMSVDAVQRVNETLGLSMGDRLCKEISRRLTEILRGMDTVAILPSSPTVSRLGQDEFGILLTDLEEVDAITWIVKRILNVFENAFSIDGNEIYTATNIGISIYPNDGESPEELVKNAAAAKSHAKKTLGNNQYYFYSESIHNASIKHLHIESRLHKAIQNNEFILHYQPKINARTGKINGVEALIRWQDPETGLVPPCEFIAIAEYSGFINTIGDWVLVTACRQCRKWLDMGISDCSVAVNFSARQFRQKNLTSRIREILNESKLDPKHLVIEVTESAMMENMHNSIKVLQKIRESGVRVAMDDFGTGYSSLGYLKNFPLTHLKIDRSFVADIETNNKDAILVKSIISMAHGMGLKITAEGVENAAQVNLLLQYGCDEMQGFLFSKPVPVDEATQLFHDGIASGITSQTKNNNAEINAEITS